jgi:hypothetical protein
MIPWLSLVIPTVGRPELARTFDSIDHQAHADGLEVLVVGDTFEGPTDELKAAGRETKKRGYRWLEHDGGEHCVGQPQRQFGMQQAAAPWIAFSADDNILTRDALASIWFTITQLPEPIPILFKVRTWQAGVVWKAENFIVQGNLDADCMVVPNVPEKLGHWPNFYEGDFLFARDTARLWGRVAWRPDLISLARPAAAECWW